MCGIINDMKELVDIYYINHGEVDSFLAFYKDCTYFPLSTPEETLLLSIVNLKKCMIVLGHGAEPLNSVVPSSLKMELG